MKIILFAITLLFTAHLLGAPDPMVRDNVTGFELTDLDNGRIKESKNGHKLMIPASTTKLLTGAYILEGLGGNYRFSTNLAIDGKIKDGVLIGNLYLVGNGDPMFSAGDMLNMALKLKAQGIKKITGSFFFDESLLKHIDQVAPAGDLDTTDNPGISALSCEFNRFKLYSKGKKLIPSPSLLQLKGKWVEEDFPVDTNNERADGTIDNWKLSKKREYRFPLHLPVKNPAPYTAQYFAMLAAQEGITLPTPTPGITPSFAKTIVTHKSITAIELVDLNLEYSNNLLSELMLIAAVKKRTGIAVNLKQAGSELVRWLIQFTGDKDWAKSKLVSGSGLNHGNQFSPHLLTSFLYKMRNKSYGDKYYRSILSISGQKGWLYKRMDTPEMAYKVWAKTGTLNYAGGLSGYLYAKSGKRYAFTILTTNFKMREAIASGTPKKRKKLEDQARTWKNNIRKKHDHQIKKWIREL